ncbi:MULTISPECIES: DUF3857 domain-containing protein [unclassified Aureispira]|uniref:DUF3857 domain-containing protein n=1 Tax=unclassified Aureispira TaxID=2649989 RepID=UPI0006966956|nr:MULTISPECIES: DUF3857 domain-containing protein [unclassified Aureispira]WMX17400.1 DUF3857 domain-containing protein [Aureispira sp. CCB-E]
MRLIILACVSCLLFTANVLAQKDVSSILLEDYTQENVQEYCWEQHAYNKAEEEYPEDWNNQSAVFLRYERKYEIRFVKAVAYVASARLHVSYISHYRVKILDEAALENFSEVYYVSGAHGGYNMYDETRDKEFMNIKIIKPNGKEIIVDNKEIIEDDNGKRKVAVPNLEVGDILDYALYTHDLATSFFYGVIDEFTLNRAYPIKDFNYSVTTDRDWDVQFTSGKHEINLSEKTINDNCFEFSIHKENVEKINSTRWNYYYQTGPYIRMYVGYSKDNLALRRTKGGALHTSSLKSEDIIDTYRDYYEKSRSAFNEYAAFKGYLRRKYKKEEISKTKTLEELYYYMRHHFTNKHYVYDRYYGNANSFRKLSNIEFTGHIIYALKKLKIPYDIVVVVGRQSGRIEDVINKNQTDYLIRAKLDDSNIYFYRPNPYTRFNHFPFQIENAEGYVVEAENTRGRKLTTKKALLPASDYKSNISRHETKVHFKEDDMMVLRANSKAIHTGHHIESYQYDVVDWMDMIWNENKLYKTKLWGHPSKDKSSEMKNFIQAQKEERDEAMEAIAQSHFDLGEGNTELIAYEGLTTANTIDEKSLEYTFDCELSDLVKKVGPNYVIKAGRLVGGQLILAEDEMERTVDIHMNYPRGYEYEIEITIPEGYEVKGLDNFTNNIDNETGSLKSSASLNGNILTITFNKYYKNNYEPAKNWDMMKAFLIPGGEFLTKEILLKKKRS